MPAEHLGELVVGDVAQHVADIAPLLAVFHDLAAADLVHRRIVADDAQERQVEAHAGLEIPAGKRERAVAEIAQHLLLGMDELRRHGEGDADAKGAERPRVHPMAGRARLDGLGRDGDDVAAVADIDRVLGQELVDLIGDAEGIDRHRVGLEFRQQLLVGRFLRRAELLHPAPALAGAVVHPPGRRRRHRREHGADIADQAERDVAVLADGAVIEVDLHHRGVGAKPRSIAHAEIERRAGDDDDVGLIEGDAPGAVEVMGIAGREGAAAGAIEIGRDVEGAGELLGGGGGARGPNLGAEQHAGALRCH